MALERQKPLAQIASAPKRYSEKSYASQEIIRQDGERPGNRLPSDIHPLGVFAAVMIFTLLVLVIFLIAQLWEQQGVYLARVKFVMSLN